MFRFFFLKRAAGFRISPSPKSLGTPNLQRVTPVRQSVPRSRGETKMKLKICVKTENLHLFRKGLFIVGDLTVK